MEPAPTRGPEQYPAGTTTGRFLVLFEEGTTKAKVAKLHRATGASAALEAADDPPSDTGRFFEALGVAVLDSSPEQLQVAGLEADDSPAILAVEPERINRALGLPGVAESPATPRSADYLQGFRDAVLHLTAPGGTTALGAAAVAAVAVDESQATWGLQAVRAVNSCWSGKGVRVAVLDTGCDLQHPDLQDRGITSRSFVPGEEVQDGNGHGTHCIGTSMGPKCPPTGPRYGVAHEAEIFAGKVLGNAGSGGDAQILGGINWAVENGCAVISMSLGAATRPGQPFSKVFEEVAARAQRAGTLIVAAAGNESDRPGVVNPVGHPANCPSILAIAALDAQGAVARFSNRGIDPVGGQVDAAGPGVDVYSTSPMPTRYRRLSGTSMATPHAAGVAALLAEANPATRGAALGLLLTTRARRLDGLSSADVGAGLIQAP